MTWNLTDDADLFARTAVPRLAEHPVENTLVLTITEWLRAGHRHSDQPVVLGWYDGGPALGAVVMTPPFEMILTQVDIRAVAALVETLRKRAVDVPGVSGDVEAIDAFAACWRAGTDLEQRTVRLQRLYKLNRLLEPPNPPVGRPRLATMADLPVLVGWLDAFYLEAGLPETDAEAAVAGRIADNRLWIWADERGVDVSFAGRQQTAAGVARVGPVYTPPEHRRRGYGAGVTAACTADALRRDAHDVALFTDLANPTSNAIYQQIGFEPVADSKVVRFVPPNGADPGGRPPGPSAG